MAVFVMAVGILSMVVLYPLGLRESTQGRADLKQAVFADDVLNQMVALLSQTNITWSTWNSMRTGSQGKKPTGWTEPKGTVKYQIICRPVEGYSEKIMGIMVQSTEQEKANLNQYSNNPVYYAEALFQGDPTK